MADARSGLRERTRRAVQAELIDVAQRLFVEHGYEGTTIDQIATAVGMSQRSFFRYFAGKDELVLAKYEQLGDLLAGRLAERPADEGPWPALRHTFDVFVEYVQSPGADARLNEIERVIERSPVLRAGYLERIDRIQARLAEVLRARGRATGHAWADGHPAPEALVSAAFGCATAARAVGVRTGAEYRVALDEAMDAIAEFAVVGSSTSAPVQG